MKKDSTRTVSNTSQFYVQKVYGIRKIVHVTFTNVLFRQTDKVSDIMLVASNSGSNMLQGVTSCKWWYEGR